MGKEEEDGRSAWELVLLGPHFLTGPVVLFQYWAFSDIQTGRVLTKVTDETSGCCKLPRGRRALCSLFIVSSYVVWRLVLLSPFEKFQHHYHLGSGSAGPREEDEAWGSPPSAVRQPELPLPPPQLSPALSSTLMASFSEQEPWTLRSRSGT